MTDADWLRGIIGLGGTITFLPAETNRLTAIADKLDRLEAPDGLIQELAEALEVFARCPTHGKHGGPFVIANASFEDMCKGDSAPREAYWHLTDFEKARSALAKVRAHEMGKGG